MELTNAIIQESKTEKKFKSPDYNYYFNKVNGLFIRWGKTKDEDPVFSPYGPEIADIEISTICHGVEGIGPCKFCYKSNTGKGEYMNLFTFTQVFKKLPPTLTQIAFGIGDIDANPDMWKIFDYCNEQGVKPNVTVNGEGMTTEIARKMKDSCGAVAVSVYDKDKSYNTVKMLTDTGMKQINIHFMISEQTYDNALTLLNDRLNDPRLSDMNAIVLLSLKPKGRANKNFYTSLSQEKFKHLVDVALEKKINFGFDSCGQHKFLQSVKNSVNYASFEQLAEGCESTKFSAYVDVKGDFFPCSFMDGESVDDGGNWENGLDIVNCNDFLTDIWYNEKTIAFRNKCNNCTESNGGCCHYKI